MIHEKNNHFIYGSYINEDIIDNIIGEYKNINDEQKIDRSDSNKGHTHRGLPSQQEKFVITGWFNIILNNNLIPLSVKTEKYHMNNFFY